MNYAIETKGLTKYYGTTKVLEDISIQVTPGAFIALVGKNGVGKSTLMRILMRYDRPTTGQGWMLGNNLESDADNFNVDIGYVSEGLDFAVPTSLRTFFEYYSRLHPRWDQKIFDQVLGEMSVPKTSQFRDLSRGQKMQVGFAAAMAIKPKLLVLDEITAVMDANARNFFMDYLGNFAANGNTVFMATNIISEVQRAAQHVLLLHEGGAMLDCPVTDIAKNFHKVRQMPGVSDPIFTDKTTGEVTLNNDGSISYVLPMEAAKKHANAEKLRDKRGITIEEIFIYLTRPGGNKP